MISDSGASYAKDIAGTFGNTKQSEQPTLTGITRLLHDTTRVEYVPSPRLRRTI